MSTNQQQPGPKDVKDMSYEDFWKMVKEKFNDSAATEVVDPKALASAKDWEAGKGLLDATEELLKAEDALVKASQAQYKLLNVIACHHPHGEKILEYLRRGSEDSRFSSHCVVAYRRKAIALDLQASGDEESMSSGVSESEEEDFSKPISVRSTSSDESDTLQRQHVIRTLGAYDEYSFSSDDDDEDADAAVIEWPTRIASKSDRFSGFPGVGKVSNKSKPKETKEGGDKQLDRKGQMLAIELAAKKLMAERRAKKQKGKVGREKGVKVNAVDREAGPGLSTGESGEAGAHAKVNNQGNFCQAQDILQLHRDLLKSDPVLYLKYYHLPALPVAPSFDAGKPRSVPNVGWNVDAPVATEHQGRAQGDPNPSAPVPAPQGQAQDQTTSTAI